MDRSPKRWFLQTGKFQTIIGQANLDLCPTIGPGPAFHPETMTCIKVGPGVIDYIPLE